MKVLVVDDSAIVRERLVEVLSALQGVEHVDTAARASEARLAIQSARPDVVLLDIHMPGGSGIEVLEALRADNRRIMTIVLTNDPAPQWRAASLRAGADFFFDKSAEFQQAIDLIAHLALGRAGPGFQAGPVARENDEALRQNGILNRSLLEYLPLRIFVKDRQSRYVFCNSSYALDLGIEPRQIVGEDDFAFFPSELAERYRADDRSVMSDGKIRILDERYTVAGEEQWVHTIKAPYRNEEGEIIGVLALFEDITERRRTEELLRLEGAALHAAADAIIITDSAGVVEWVNQAFTQLTGYTAEEAIGRNPRDLVKSGKHSQAFYKEFWETILAGRTWHGEMINRRKDGSLYSEDQAVTPIRNASGAITHFVAIKEDVTERLQLEAQYRQAQRMESVGLLASGIAHDFNNLLTVINGMAELVLEQVSKDVPMYADVQEIHRAGLRAAALTRQLSAFSRQQALERRVMNLNTVVAGMESLLRRLLGEDIDLVAVLSPDVCSVRADPGQIEQVITNLAVNARDAMPQGGRLTIETQKVTIDNGRGHQHPEAVPPGSYVQLSVSDSGIGMDARAHLRAVFHDQGPGQGHGAGAVDRVRHRQAEPGVRLGS
jgi:PAS domain S-box-containing protein